MARVVEKVLAYVIRQKGAEKQVLVFTHRDFPEEGVQVPGGTVEPGELANQAVLRELEEEAGIALKAFSEYLGRFEWKWIEKNQIHFRNIFQLHAEESTPESWAHTVGGQGGDRNREFNFYWLSIGEAQKQLVAEQGKYLDQLKW